MDAFIYGQCSVPKCKWLWILRDFAIFVKIQESPTVSRTIGVSTVRNPKGAPTYPYLQTPMSPTESYCLVSR